MVLRLEPNRAAFGSSGLVDCPGRWAGLLTEWRREQDYGRWAGRVVYVVDDAGQVVLVEAWIYAEHLSPAQIDRPL